MKPQLISFSPVRGFLGLPPYRDSITQLIVHSLYQSLLLHHQQQRERGRAASSDLLETTAVEMECRLGQLIPKHQRKQHQQERILHASSRDGAGIADPRGVSDSSDMRYSPYDGASSAGTILSSFPVTTPAVLHHKAQYQCRFDVGISSPSLQRLEYLLRIPHRRPPHVIPKGEAPLRDVKTQLLPASIVVHEDDSSRHQFVIEKQSGERVVRFNSSQTKNLAYQSDILCPHWSSDMRLSVAVEKIRRLLAASASNGGFAKSCETAPLRPTSQRTASEWIDRISAIFFQNQRSRTAVGRHFWVDIATVQTLPHTSAFLRYGCSPNVSSGEEHSMYTQLYELLQHPGSTCRLDALRGLSLALMNRSRIRKVELEINIANLYTDWSRLARYCHSHSVSHALSLPLRPERSRSRYVDARLRGKQMGKKEIIHRRFPPIPRDLYARELLDASRGGGDGPNACSYPTFFEMDIHRPIEFGGLTRKNSEHAKGMEAVFLYGVAQQMLTLLQFLGAGAQS